MATTLSASVDHRKINQFLYKLSGPLCFKLVESICRRRLCNYGFVVNWAKYLMLQTNIRTLTGYYLKNNNVVCTTELINNKLKISSF